jgi:predicted branched-subunit amino acid permease
MTSVVAAGRRSRLGRHIDPGAIRDIAPMGVAVAPLGVVVGVTVVSLGIPRLVGQASSPLIYSGSAQLTYLTLVSADAGLMAVLGALLLANSRLIIYSSGLAPYFRDQPAWFRWLTPTFIVDQTYVVVAGRDDLRDPARFRRYWLTAGSLLGVIWTAATATGMVAGPLLQELFALDVAAPALFLGLLVPRIVDRGSLVVASLAGAVAAATHGVVGPLALPLAMLSGVALVALTNPQRLAAGHGVEVRS